jgi:hypothetical protein
VALTQLNGTQIRDSGITGADLVDEIGVYNETNDYYVGDVVFWDKTTYKCISNVIGVESGDISYSPTVSMDWEEITKDYDVLMYSVSPSVSQNFLGSRQTLILDTENIQSDYASVSSNEITILKDIVLFVSVTINIGITNSSTSRTVSHTFLQVDQGSGFYDVNNFKMSGYHRRVSYSEDSSSAIVPINLVVGDKLRVQMRRYAGSAQLGTIIDGCVVNLFSIEGLQGAQGQKGDPGDMTWEGTWTSSRNYSVYNMVEYNGSSYICIDDTTTQPPSDILFWDIVVLKGVDGSGSSLDIQCSGVALPGSPFTTINFTGNIECISSSGIATIDVVDQLPKWYLGVGEVQSIQDYTVHYLGGSTPTFENESQYIFNTGSILII